MPRTKSSGVDARIPNVDELPDAALLTRAQLSVVSGFSVVTLKVWGRQNRGPRITFIDGRLPRYRADHVRAWLQGDAA